MQLVSIISNSFSKFKVIILLLIFNNFISYSQTSDQTPRVRFIWTDNTFKTSNNSNIYLLSTQDQYTDTIFPSVWKPLQNDTIYFNLNDFKNPVYVELLVDTTKKRSNSFNLIQNSTYNLTEFDDKLEVKARSLVFDTIDSKAQKLYSFLVKLFLELLIAIPIAALFRLPARLIFFVFVANIMSFPLVYITIFPFYIMEIATILLEGLFIFLIGWKRLKITKALLVSLLMNVIRFGVYKVVMLIIRIL